MLRLLKYCFFIFLFSFSFQEGFQERLARQLTSYYDLHQPAKVLITLSQPEYAPGDTAFYSMFLVHAEHNRFISGRRLVHVNLADHAGKVIAHQKVLAVDGKASNQFIVPDNQGIFNVYVTLPGISDATFAGHFRIVQEKVLQRIEQKKALSVFPEGGTLVQNVNNRIVISGNPLESIEILDSQSRIITSATLGVDGLQSVYLQPRANTQYYIRSKGEMVTLPQSKDGVAMVLTLTKPEFPLRITLQVPEESMFRKEDFHLIVSHHDRIYYSGRVNFESKTTVLALVPQAGWPSGVMRASVFTSSGVLLSERLFAINSDPAIDADIVLDKDAYSPRNKVNARVRLSGPTNLKSVFSCAVNNVEMLPADSSDTFEQGVTYYADLFRTRGCGDIKDVSDQFMITKKWSGASWDEVLKGTNEVKARSAHLRLSGVLTANGKPVPDSTFISFLLQNNVTVYNDYTTDNGHFDIPLLFFFDGTDEVLYRATYNGQVLTNTQISLASDSIGPGCEEYKAIQHTNRYASFMQQKRAIDRTYRTYLADDRKFAVAENLNAIYEEEIFGADATFKMSDYRIFPNMEETLREIVLLVQHRKHKNKSEVRVWFDRKNIFAKADPLYIIDGVVTEDTDYFMSLIPERIETIKVVHSADKLRTFGTWGQNGIILVETRIPGNAANVRRSLNSFTMTGLNPSMNFNAPKHITDSHLPLRVPDLRACLYWNPIMNTDASGEALISFFTPDNTGSFSIRISGITEDGTPFAVSKNFTVNKPYADN